jgi:hypothetical protein
MSHGSIKGRNFRAFAFTAVECLASCCCSAEMSLTTIKWSVDAGRSSPTIAAAILVSATSYVTTVVVEICLILRN